MSWTRPTLKQIVDRIDRDIESRLLGKVALLQKAMLWILSRIFAGAVHIAYGYLEELARQIMPDTATGEWLKRHARIWGVRLHSASYASGYVAFLGAEGSEIPEGQEVRSHTGLEYITVVSGKIMDGVAKIPCQAVNFGTESNLNTSSNFNLIEALPAIQTECYAGLVKLDYINKVGGNFSVGDTIVNLSISGEGIIIETDLINSLLIAVKSGSFFLGNNFNNGIGISATISINPYVLEGFTGGQEEESDESLQIRIIERIQQAPSAGSKDDYIRWAKDTVSENGIVNNAWTFSETPSVGYATIAIKNAGDNPTASSLLVADVLKYINVLKPVTANIIVASIIDVKISMTINLPSIYNKQSIKDTITNNIKELFTSEAIPGGVIYISQIRNAISSAGIPTYVIQSMTSNIALTPAINPNNDIVFTGLQYGTIQTISFGVL